MYGIVHVLVLVQFVDLWCSSSNYILIHYVLPDEGIFWSKHINKLPSEHH